MKKILLIVMINLLFLIGTAGIYAAEKPDGGYAVFDGVDDYMMVNGSESLNVTSAITLGGWIKPADGTNTILEYNSGGSLGVHLWTHLDNDPFVNFVDTGSGYHILKGGPENSITLDQWHLIMTTYDSSSGMGRLFMDGTEVMSGDLGSFDLKTDANLYFGLRPGATDYIFNGAMDELTVYNRALSSEEVSLTYTRGQQGMKSDITDGLVGYWSFDEGFNDSSGYDNHGTAYGELAIMGVPAVAPEPVSSTLFMIGGATLGFRRFRKKRSKI